MKKPKRQKVDVYKFSEVIDFVVEKYGIEWKQFEDFITYLVEYYGYAGDIYVKMPAYSNQKIAKLVIEEFGNSIFLVEC